MRSKVKIKDMEEWVRRQDNPKYSETCRAVITLIRAVGRWQRDLRVVRDKYISGKITFPQYEGEVELIAYKIRDFGVGEG